MGLSRLDNFLKSVSGRILYVDPSSLDATDSIENQGNSLTRPFRTIQRALIEAARFSYQRGLDNDRFAKTTILLYPGEHFVDNRPGWIPDGGSNFRLRDGSTSSDLSQWTLLTDLDVASAANNLYKLNSISGGIIIPRGTSIVGMDLRKTKIRPLYVPNPENDEIERSAVFKVTGACYLWQFTLLDSDPNGNCYKDYTSNQFVPNFSHHKLSGFEYADGANRVKISDDFMTYETDRTDLDMYYEKVGIVYGESSGRPVSPDYPSNVDLQPVIDEYRIVGSRGFQVGISSIRSGDGVTSNTTITVTLAESADQFNVDTPIQIQGVGAAGYDGQFVVSEVTSATQLKYKVQNAPTNALPTVAGSTISIAVDTVTSASPYIFNVSLRSVYGMCGMLADGSKADGFKSMVVAQYTGIGLQKDDNAFVKYNSSTGTYQDSTAIDNLHSDSRAIFKPTYQNFHIKAINDSYIQIVSVFAIGYAEHFSVESGGDHSINNSNSNFGSKALVASGFRKNAFSRDDTGYITHIIHPKEIDYNEVSVNFSAIDVTKTVGIASVSRLYLYNETNFNEPPQNVIDGYRIGAKANDTLYLDIVQGGTSTKYSSRIIMPNTQSTGTEVSSEKIVPVGRSVGINSITTNIVTLTGSHPFINGESVRVIGDNGHLPDGLDPNQVYYAITNTVSAGLGTDKIKIAQTLNDAINDNALTINSKGGVLRIVSRVSDKNSGDIGHPIQWDSSQSQWYVNVATAATENSIYPAITSFGTAGLGNATSRTYVTRQTDDRGVTETIYKVRYVVPKDSSVTARPPLDGYILQESNSVTASTTNEVAKYFNPSGATLTNSTELRNFRFIANANWAGGTANIITELPHDLTVGAEVEVLSVKSTNNTAGIANSAFNGTHTVTGISSTKQFSFSLTSDPGSFTNDTTVRNTNLPTFKRKKLGTTYQLYRNQEIQEYVPNIQDGVYHLILVNSGNSPTVTPFTDYNLSQPVQNLYPQKNRDNANSDPIAAECFAVSDPIGKVVVNNPEYSITKQTLQKNLFDFSVGIGLTNIISSSGTVHTLYTTLDHGLSGITSVSISNAGAGYSTGTFYGARLTSGSGANATARVTVSAAGTITNIKIMDGGSAYSIGESLTISGITTVSGYSAGICSVTNIYSNVGDCLSVSGVSSATYNGYNTLYKVTAVPTSKTVTVQSSESIASLAGSTGVGVTLTSDATATLTGTTLGISTFIYTSSTGIGTLTFSKAHGFGVNNKLRIGGADQALFNDDFLVTNVNSSTSATINVGVSTASVSTGGIITVYRPLLTSSGGDLTKEVENTSGRLAAQYAGITTTLGTNFNSSDSDTNPITIPNADILGFNLGDYLLIDDEIMRIKQEVSGSTVYVFRALFGTLRQNHVSGTAVKKIKPQPVEFRRNSIIRASAHTFEYLGYGPGNYSTAFPERQDRILSAEEILLAQSFKKEGGISIYTGMDDGGNFYTGNKKLNSATGQEEVYDAPIPSVTGEDIGRGTVNVGFDVLSPLEISVNRRIKVEGGDDNTLISEFGGPVVFNSKLTSTSEDGIEAKSLFLQGDADVSRKITIGTGSTPTTAGTPGDVVNRALPPSNGYLGWIYTLNNQWEPYGYIGTLPSGIAFGSADQVLYKDPSNVNSGNSNFLFKDNSTLIIGAATSTGTASQKVQVTGDAYVSGSVGIGLTNPSNPLHVVGVISATSYRGNGSTLSEIPTSIIVGGGLTTTGSTGIVTISISGELSKWSRNSTGIHTLGNVGVGTTTATAALNVSSGVSTSVDGGLARFSSPNLGIGSVTSFSIGRNFNSTTNFQSVLFGYNYFGSSASSGSFLAISHAGQGNTLVIADSDRVGIKTSTPQATLHVNGTIIGNGTIPVGGIIMWSGTISNIPSGWALCNGSNGTPDLRSKFIVGAGTDTATTWEFSKTTGSETFTNSQTSPNVGATGGSVGVGLTTGEMPSHTHRLSRFSGTNNVNTQSGRYALATDNNSTTDSTLATGSNLYHENRPPYYALAFIMRTV
jgi:microcystin-dependent protein